MTICFSIRERSHIGKKHIGKTEIFFNSKRQYCQRSSMNHTGFPSIKKHDKNKRSDSLSENGYTYRYICFFHTALFNQESRKAFVTITKVLPQTFLQ